MAHDRSSIVARSPRHRSQITLQFGPQSPLSDGHDHRAIVAIKSLFRPDQTALKSHGNSPLKTDVSPLVFLNSRLNREGIKRFERKILSSS